jgi:hypothetical protein
MSVTDKDAEWPWASGEAAELAAASRSVIADWEMLVEIALRRTNLACND